MGQNDSKYTLRPESKIASKFLCGLTFVMWTETPQFGPIELFQMIEKPYDYVMKYSHKASSRLQLQKLKLVYESFQPHRSLVDIQAVVLQEKKQLCTQFNELSVYCRYYNFTLQDAILRKRQHKDFYFSESHLFYVLRNLLETGRFFHNTNKTNLKSFNTDSIFLSPEGYLKIYLFQKDHDPKKKNHQRLGQTRPAISARPSCSSEAYTSQHTAVTEEDSGFKRLAGNSKQKFDPNQDLYDIGIVMMSLALLKSKQYYFDGGSEPRTDLLSEELEFNWPTNYSQTLKSIVQGMITMEPQKRISWSELMMRIDKLKDEKFFKEAFYLKLDQSCDSQFLPQKMSNQRKDSFLRSLATHKKLIPAKVESVNPESKFCD